jgi:preprotein translocase subunit SecD
MYDFERSGRQTGKSIPAAIDAVSSRVSTIIDTHVTTVVSCAFLFIFGSDRSKASRSPGSSTHRNVFTAVFVSRTMFDFSVS